MDVDYVVLKILSCITHICMHEHDITFILLRNEFL